MKGEYYERYAGKKDHGERSDGGFEGLVKTEYRRSDAKAGRKRARIYAPGREKLPHIRTGDMIREEGTEKSFGTGNFFTFFLTKLKNSDILYSVSEVRYSDSSCNLYDHFNIELHFLRSVYTPSDQSSARKGEECGIRTERKNESNE